jgi:gliding motility-associated-like protein
MVVKTRTIMKKSTLSLAIITYFCLLFSVNLSAQNTATVEWAKRFGGTNVDYLFDMASDAQENVYITGIFRGTAIFGSIFLNAAGTSTHGTPWDMYVAKLDSSGNVLWALRFGSTGDDYAYGIETDNFGNVYVTGSFQGTVSFGSHTLVSAGGADAFVVKIAANSNVLWAKQFAAGTNWVYGHGVATDDAGNVYATGHFGGTASFDTNTLTALNSDLYVAKISPGGVVLWLQHFQGSASSNSPRDAAVDTAGNVYVTGRFSGDMTFGTTTLTSFGGRDVFVAKISTNGNLLWARQFGGTGNDQGIGIGADAFGNVYVTGDFSNTANFGTNTLTAAGAGLSTDGFIAKFSQNDSLIWVQQFGGNSYDEGHRIDVNATGDIYTIGRFGGTATFGTITATTNGSNKFISKTDSSGNALWVKSFETSFAGDYSGISCATSGKVYAGGEFLVTTDFEADILNSLGSYDVFVLKLSDDCGSEIRDTISENICAGTNYSLGTQTIDTTGTYTEIFQNASGCDSIVVLNLTVSALYRDTVFQTSCDNFLWPVNGQTYTQSGFYTETFTDLNNCDSIHYLDLTITPSVGSAPVPTFFNTGNNGAGGTLPGAANDLNWTVAEDNINGIYNPAFIMSSIPGNYYSSPWPDATWIAHNANGSHTVNQDFFYRIDFALACQDACGGLYSDPDVFCLNLDFFADNAIIEIYINGVPQSGNITAIPVANPYNYTGYAQNNMVSVSFCDGWQPGNNTLIAHVVSGPGFAGFLAQASINPPLVFTDSISESICGGLTYTFGTQVLDSSGIYTETFQNQLGCDSVVILNLTVNQIFSDSINVTACDSFFWSFSGQTYNTTGNYAHTVPNAFNCDSSIYMNLTIENCSFGCLNPDVCYSTEPFPVSNFNIEKKFESVENTAVYQTPLIADMDGDCIPEIIIAGTTGAINSPRLTSGIRIVNSVTGATISNIPTAFYAWSAPTGFAIADVDYDGIPDIVLAAANHTSNPIDVRGKLVCYNTDGTVKWISDQEFGVNADFGYGGSVAFADFNQDGIPEVYIYNEIFNAQTGVKLANGGQNGLGVADNSVNLGTLSVTVAAQLDSDDNDLELAAGYTTYKVNITNTNGMNGNSIIPYNIQVDNVLRDGFTSVADINNDGQLDIVVASEGIIGDARLYAYYIDNVGNPVLIAQASPTSATSNLEYKIGPPFIGDIDGSGVPAIGITRSSRLITFQYNGTANFQQKWIINTNDVSGQTGLTMFDFNQDGIQEIVYRDETDLLIYDGSGATPVVMASFLCASLTGVERPIVADIDNTGASKICVTCGPTLNGKLEVFGAPDGQQPWAPSRGVWNQFGYHVLNINDNLTVPAQQLNNATYYNGAYNNFNVQISLIDSAGNLLVPSPDLSGEITCLNYDVANQEYTLTFNLSNYANASLTAPDSITVAFFNGNPETNGTLLGTYETQDTIAVGGALSNLVFTFPGAGITNMTTIYLAVNSAGNQTGSAYQPSDYIINECDFSDNIVSFNITLTYDTLQDSICSGGVYQFYNNLYDTAGTYYHNLTNSSGCDSVIVVLELLINPVLVSTDSVASCDTYTWTLNNQTFTQSGIYTDTVQTLAGCDSVVILNLTIRESNNDSVSETICGNSTFEFGSQTIDTSGIYVETFQNQFGCDSTVTLQLIVLPIPNSTSTADECDSYTWVLNNQTFSQSGLYVDTVQNAAGCDSIVFLNLTIRETTTATLDTIICSTYTAPDGQEYNSNGTYTAVITNQAACDSIITINLTVEEIFSDFSANPLLGVAPLTVSFTNTSNNAIFSIWNFGDSLSTDTTFNPSFIFNQDGEYIVSLVSISANGCTDTSETTIVVEKIELTIPNVFSPNGDGINDTFRVIAKGYKLLKGEIYNRWGMKLYEWDKPNASWDGRTTTGMIVPEGTYFYAITIEDTEGKQLIKTGPLSLFR